MTKYYEVLSNLLFLKYEDITQLTEFKNTIEEFQHTVLGDENIDHRYDCLNAEFIDKMKFYTQECVKSIEEALLEILIKQKHNLKLAYDLIPEDKNSR